MAGLLKKIVEKVNPIDCRWELLDADSKVIRLTTWQLYSQRAFRRAVFGHKIDLYLPPETMSDNEWAAFVNRLLADCVIENRVTGETTVNSAARRGRRV